MESMFSSCSLLNSLDLSKFDTSKINNMYSMFFVCKNLIFLNLSNLNASSVTTMENIFSDYLIL